MMKLTHLKPHINPHGFLCINKCSQCQEYTGGSAVILRFLSKELLKSKRPLQPCSTSVCFTVCLALGHLAFFSWYFNCPLVCGSSAHYFSGFLDITSIT